ncbi:glycoside hydrolase family 3 C-terminal domain-containing protein [Clostridium neonatale]|uniref:Xylan 1,4-beta-xylosidase n=2 Tax=Clostridium neonatale TaxID=137838 RepID=A0A650LPP6_9CLOT|nr:glycoside hydrolase family 3 C-terminal domain-containing protein [Clostridium neonatale]MBP8313179.1 glycoside hydrolase family 3 C-terminal domain-containing protein [Clostridium neonatale]CAG9711318.1 Xylan 1,4-beta-xylosidase [Clostridium neonatale]CAI3539057.1 beta-glucosidase [Clostridium neonatale]CAI3561729.1 beta-glucosidase [Clostridium neonatale]CAI3570237.1 beta-glucosidase [Clostridium neonatale]
MKEKNRITHEEALTRAKELVEKMTLQEKAEQLTYNAAAIKRLNIPRYNWWNEGLHGVARAGTATVFPQAIGLASTFDEELLENVADTIATEGRAKYNEYSSKDDRDIYKGITYWSPNVNIFRDPRWGRGHETYGEDPYLTSRLGVAFINGLQGEGKYLKIAACAKHFAVHSGPEGIRHEFNAVTTKKDLYETYLPAFEACVKEADVEAVMGAYNRTNGEPCCGSKTLLKDILRGKWNFKGHVVSDCWAIADFHLNHKVTSTATESAALAIKNGCDLNCGNVYLQMMLAYKEGLVTEEDITTSAERLIATRIRLGMFDDKCEYNEIPYESNDCKEHNELSLKAARKSMVLLKNDGTLPIDKSSLKSIAVIGPNADSQVMLKGNYSGTASKYTTILEGIHEAVNEDTRVYYSEGCHLYKDRVEGLAQPKDRISEAVSVAERSDVVVVCLGLDSTIEGEQGDAGNSYGAGDKENLNLPGTQQELLEKVLETKKPVIVILGSGSALTLNGLEESCAAIIQAWYPGSHGGTAAADLIFGKCSPSGKLPVTFYKSIDNMLEFSDYSMKGRTYRYIEEEALYPFGYGLTYSQVELNNLNIEDIKEDFENVNVSIDIKNIGGYDVEEVVQCYLKNLESRFAVLNHSLVAFKRISLKNGESKTVTLNIRRKEFEVVNDEGERILDSKKFKLFVGVSQPDKRSIELTGITPLEKELNLK